MASGVLRIFVYGTLMRGEDNASFLRGARFAGAARTEPRYTLVDLGDYPGLCDGGATSVVGELYDVDEPILVRVDELEGHPDLFRRASVTLAGGGTAIAYLLAAERPGAVIASGDWRSRG